MCVCVCVCVCVWVCGCVGVGVGGLARVDVGACLGFVHPHVSCVSSMCAALLFMILSWYVVAICLS